MITFPDSYSLVFRNSIDKYFYLISEWSAIEPEIGDTLQQSGHQMDR